MGYKTKVSKKNRNQRLRFHSGDIRWRDPWWWVEGRRDENVPTKALLASALTLVAFSLFSSVSSARVSLRSSGEGVDSLPAEEASESLIAEEQAQILVR